MDILYIVGKGCSSCNDFELRMSLRSIEMYGRNLGRVFVSGHCPEWLSDQVVKIPRPNYPYRVAHGFNEKGLNIASSALYAMKNSDIGDHFLVSMDDHFYVREVDFDNYPWHVRVRDGSPHLPTAAQATTAYRKYLYNSAMYLKSKGLPDYNFAIHRNMHCTRKAVLECEDYINEILMQKIPCELWLLVGNYEYSKGGVQLTPARDVKIAGAESWWRTAPERTEVFSTANFSVGSPLYNLLLSRYPKPSKYERTW